MAQSKKNKKRFRQVGGDYGNPLLDGCIIYDQQENLILEWGGLDGTDKYWWGAGFHLGVTTPMERGDVEAGEWSNVENTCGYKPNSMKFDTLDDQIQAVIDYSAVWGYTSRRENLSDVELTRWIRKVTGKVNSVKEIRDYLSE
jgi:hypothetical protein